MSPTLFYRAGDFLRQSPGEVEIAFSKRKAVFCSGGAPVYSSFRYPLPYCRHRETRLRVAEEISVSAMTCW